MDFASILSSEISKKRKPTSPPRNSSTTTATATATATTTAKKYQKRSELESARSAAYKAEQTTLEAARREKALSKAAAEEAAAARAEASKEKQRRLAEERRKKKEKVDEVARVKNSATSTTTTTTTAVDGEGGRGGGEIPDEETLTRLLRSLQEPIKLFNESSSARLKRYNRLQAALQKSSTPPLTEDEMTIDPSDITQNPSKVYKQLDAYFSLVLREWKLALDARPKEVMESFQGKAAEGAYTQARDYMKPLFKHFKMKSLHVEIFGKVCEIVVEAQRRKYVKANDLYLRLSIGNAAWPIGVTMVGIHERSAREKLHEKGMAAHIMSDEVTRKFLQSIKRCLSFCQTRWPPEDPLQLMG